MPVVQSEYIIKQLTQRFREWTGEPLDLYKSLELHERLCLILYLTKLLTDAIVANDHDKAEMFYKKIDYYCESDYYTKSLKELMYG